MVPAGTIPLLPFTGVILKNWPLQIVCGIGVIDGRGSIVTVTVNAAPLHPFVEGLTVYTALTGAFVVLVNVPLMFVIMITKLIVDRLPQLLGIPQRHSKVMSGRPLKI